MKKIKRLNKGELDKVSGGVVGPPKSSLVPDQITPDQVSSSDSGIPPVRQRNSNVTTTSTSSTGGAPPVPTLPDLPTS